MNALRWTILEECAALHVDVIRMILSVRKAYTQWSVSKKLSNDHGIALTGVGILKEIKKCRRLLLAGTTAESRERVVHALTREFIVHSVSTVSRHWQVGTLPESIAVRSRGDMHTPDKCLLPFTEKPTLALSDWLNPQKMTERDAEGMLQRAVAALRGNGPAAADTPEAHKQLHELEDMLCVPEMGDSKANQQQWFPRLWCEFASQVRQAWQLFVQADGSASADEESAGDRSFAKESVRTKWNEYCRRVQSLFDTDDRKHLFQDAIAEVQSRHWGTYVLRRCYSVFCHIIDVACHAHMRRIIFLRGAVAEGEVDGQDGSQVHATPQGVAGIHRGECTVHWRTVQRTDSAAQELRRVRRGRQDNAGHRDEGSQSTSRRTTTDDQEAQARSREGGGSQGAAEGEIKAKEAGAHEAEEIPCARGDLIAAAAAIKAANCARAELDASCAGAEPDG